MLINKEITSKNYDEHVLEQGEQFQIDAYYEPKAISMQRRIKVILESLNPNAGEKILDLGCGVGTFAFHAAIAGAISSGVDYSEESIKMAQRLVDRYELAHKPKFIAANVTKLPFDDAAFDKIIAADFIEHINLDEKERVLAEMHRVLKPDGRAVIFTPNRLREKIGDFYRQLRKIMLGDKIPFNELHFGLTDKYEFEPLLEKAGFSFNLIYKDITRPFLAEIPLLRNILALNLLWIIRKR